MDSRRISLVLAGLFIAIPLCWPSVVELLDAQLVGGGALEFQNESGSASDGK